MTPLQERLVARTITVLDDAGLPDDAGTRTAYAVLVERNHQVPRVVLNAAVALRGLRDWPLEDG